MAVNDADQNTDAALPEPIPGPDSTSRRNFAITGIFIIMTIYALYFGREFFMPVILAFLFALTLTPIVRFASKRGIPAPVSATMLVVASAVIIAVGGYLLSGPVMQLVNDAPQIGRSLTERMHELRTPLNRLLAISQQIDEVADTNRDEGVLKVAVQQPGILSQAAGNMLSAGTTIAIVFVLSLFLLASGTLFYEKIVQSFTKMSEKKRALRVVYDVEREVSRYLLTVAIINAGLGAVIAFGLWILGMPTPLLWGVMAALLNFLPYVGALLVMSVVTVISIITFDSLGYAMLVPTFLIICNVLEGQIVTPLVVGRRLELNAVSILIAVAFWSWLWGFIGALIAVPLLVVIKVFCDHFEGLQQIGNFLSAQQTMDREE
ncbi:AI-2E family transporter [Mesorhizobium microcysteis]|jgi:predicted PurR-regulated permease PerM|uniref:AI-2E family transporter n=1 Tax=Neoaquamicrobium microcysteis TaxID=2682781 RepID=A0A5D4GQR6_9HYPH|nr:AI-2E family transporter [Mesorhizobium microcysteis]TYR30059.1 AI-2E family transporter [Mesorhizobium microcysteis]